tara:strand:- start:53 stop:505 length:453 start_codon:yes stop_codon:yes gene_type:complete
MNLYIMGCYYSLLYKNKTFENTMNWSLKDKIFYVKVLKVYDGDTIWITIRLNMKIYKIKTRLYGIDTPEIKPLKSMPNRDKEISKAKESKKFLEDLVLNKIIKIKCGNWDKYGRLLITIFINNNLCSEINLNDLMVEKGLAKKYFGGTKL